MDFNTTIDIILKDLRDIRDLIEDLRNYPEIPRLQIELAISKCRSAEEVIALLKSITPAAPEHITPSEKIISEVNVIRQAGPPETGEAEAIVNVVNEGIITEQAAVNKPAAKEKDETAILADKFQGRADSVAEQFGSKIADDDISSLVRTRPVESLAKAIGINDRFLFVREIFGGNQSAFNEAIARLEKAGTMPEARAIIMSYSKLGEENEVVKQLLELVKRKLPSNG